MSRALAGAFQFLVVVLFVLTALPATAQVKLVFPQIDGLLEIDGSGSYQKVLNEAARRAGVTFTADVFPKARALGLFLSNQYDGIFTYTQTARDKMGPASIIAGYPVGAYRGFVFRAKEQPAVADFSELSGKRVGGIVGFEGTYGAITKAGAHIEMVAEDQANLAKVQAGRIYAFLGFLPDLYAKLDELSYDTALPFFESYDRLTLRNTADNRAWLAKISKELKKMHETGAVQAIVGPPYLPVRGNFAMDK